MWAPALAASPLASAVLWLSWPEHLDHPLPCFRGQLRGARRELLPLRMADRSCLHIVEQRAVNADRCAGRQCEVDRIAGPGVDLVPAGRPVNRDDRVETGAASRVILTSATPDPAASRRLAAIWYVSGRGVSTDSRLSASAVASAGPIQMGRRRSPPRSASTMTCTWPGRVAGLAAADLSH